MSVQFERLLTAAAQSTTTMALPTVPSLISSPLETAELRAIPLPTIQPRLPYLRLPQFRQTRLLRLPKVRPAPAQVRIPLPLQRINKLLRTLSPPLRPPQRPRQV